METDKIPLIYNPAAAAGKGAQNARTAMDYFSASSTEVYLIPTEASGHAIRLAEKLAGSGHKLIIACGGDGTLSEVAEGVLRSGKEVTLGFIPGGTGNDFLRSFGLTGIREAVEKITEGRARGVDAGKTTDVNGDVRYFINIFTTGFTTDVVDLANRKFKKLGAASYILSTLVNLAGLKSPYTQIQLDGMTIEGRFILTAVCNTAYTGGAMQMAPMAIADDGMLDVLILKRVRKIELLRLLKKIFSGKHIGHPAVIVEKAKKIKIMPSVEGRLSGDGEVYGYTPVEVEVLPKALKVLVGND